MHSLLTTTTDLLRVVTGSAADLDCIVSYIEYTTASPPVLDALDTQFTNIATATTTTILGAPTSGSDRRRIKAVSICNTHATTSTTCRVIIERTGPVNWDMFNTVTLAPGETLTFTEGLGWFHNKPAGKLNAYRYVTGDSVHATAATFADVTGLTVPVETGKNYNFMSHLYHVGNATTTGAQFAINGPTMTGMILNEYDIILAAPVTGSVMAGSTAVTARDTAAIVETTGAATIVMAILSGWINPSASGTFAIRATSEVTVAAGLTVKQGSWLNIWESVQG
jgi:hypothetical protein